MTESRTTEGRFASGASGNPQGARRTRERAAEDERARQRIEAGLLQDLGHEASVTERLAVEVIAAQVVRARRMRAQGRHERAEMAERLVLRGLGRLGVRKPAPKPYSIKDALAAHGIRPPSEKSIAPSPEQPAVETATSKATEATSEVLP
jgi:hypothetical protein